MEQVLIRDAGAAQQPTERRIPVGTSSISGTVVSAATGRPVPGARVSINGSATANMNAAQPAGRGRGGQVTSGNASPVWLSRMVTTDANGQFSFPRLPAGSFSISVYQESFLQNNYGQKRETEQGKPVQLADGQQLILKIPMQRGAVLAGLVTGPDGEPQRNAQVQAWRVETNSGFKRLNGNGYAQTDDRGMYRMFGLQPGEYVVSAKPNGDHYGDQSDSQAVERAIATGQILPPAAAGLTPTVTVPMAPQPAVNSLHMSSAYLPTYAPSALAPSAATSVRLVADEEKTGMDVRVQLIQATNIVGTIQTPLDPGVLVQLWLVSQDSSIDAPQANNARVNPNGMFNFYAVSPGSYYVIAQTYAAPAPMSYVNGQPVPPTQPPPVLTEAQKMFGRTQVTIAGEATVMLNVSLQRSRSISGVVLFDMPRQPDLSRSPMTVTLNVAPSPQQIYFAGPQPQCQIGPDGRFTLTGVPPGRYHVRVNGGITKSAVVAGQDTLDFPLDFTSERDITDMVLTVGDQMTDLSGTILEASGKPALDYAIVIAAADPRYWIPGSRRISVARPDQNGKYTFRGLPPGAYQLTAVIDLEPGAQFDPEVLGSLARSSVPVMIAGTSKITQDLRVK